MKPLIRQLLLFFVVLVAIVPGLVQLMLLNKYAINIPYYDDFLWGITFIVDHSKLSFWEKVQHLFSQHNQHRVFWLRIVILSIIELKGYLDFRLLTIIGNFGIFGLSLLFFRILWVHNKPIYYILPIPFIIHDLSTYHNIFVSYGVPNATVIFFAILCFYLLNRNRLWLSFLVGVLGTFTNGSGILILPLACFGLLLLYKPKKDILIYAIGTLAVLFGYFVTYETDYSELTISWQTAPYFIEFMASYLPFAANPLAQFSMTLFFFFAVYKTLRKLPLSPINTLVTISMAFLIGSGLMATLFRLIHHLPIPDWYYIYSYIFIALIYIWLQFTYQSKLIQRGCLVFFLGLSLTSYFYDFNKVISEVDALQQNLIAEAENYQLHGNWASLPLQAGLKVEKQWQDNYDTLYAQGMVRLPERITSKVPHKFSPTETFKLSQEVDYYLLEFENISQGELKWKEILGFIWNSEEQQVYYFGTYNSTNSLAKIFRNQRLFSKWSVSVISKKHSNQGLPAGNYRCGIYCKDEHGNEKWLLHDEEIVIENW